MKVQVRIYNKDALVDPDQVKINLKKSELVSEGSILNQQFRDAKPGSEEQHLLGVQCTEIAKKIINLNRRIRKNVIFI